MTGRALPPTLNSRNGAEAEGDGSRRGGGGLASGSLSEHSTWHYCAFVCRVLSQPDEMRTPLERHCVECLGRGGGTSWMPFPANLASSGRAEAAMESVVQPSKLPLSLLRAGTRA